MYYRSGFVDEKGSLPTFNSLYVVPMCYVMRWVRQLVEELKYDT